MRSRRRALALGLAVTAAALVAAGPGDAVGRARGHPDGDKPVRARASTGDSVRRPPAAEAVEAPVRIADAATVRLLRPGDRVDVIAAEQTAAGGEARVVARKALVTRVPASLGGALGATAPDGAAEVAGEAEGVDGVEMPGVLEVPGEVEMPGAVDGGALIVLSVPPATAARLAGASATARLAVTLW